MEDGRLDDGMLGRAIVVDAAALEGRGPIWGVATDELNATVLAWRAGEGQPRHVNAERDVMLVVLAGTGAVTIDADVVAVRAGTVVAIPRGAERSIAAGADGLRCVTVHRRRGGLTITRRAAVGDDATAGGAASTES
ncbi:MAG: cupin domain-containing protein [Gaiellales bacterium]